MLTPRDIDTKVFKQVLRGYSVDEVEAFLQEISESYEKIYRENLAAKERIEMLSDAVKQYKAMEDTLQNALAVARRNGEDIKKKAQEEAGAILADAKKQAEFMVNQAAEEADSLRCQFEQMKHNVEVFRSRVVSLLHAQLDVIKNYSDMQIAEEKTEISEAVYENKTENTETVQQSDTLEIPEIEKGENGVYVPKASE